MISITFDESKENYQPGEVISGTITWSELDKKTTGLETRLIWYTQGKGDQDFEVISTLVTEPINHSGTTTFQFYAPPRPYSFSGKLISLIWAVEVVLFPSRDGHRERIMISDSGEEIILDKSFEESAIKAPIRTTH